MEAGNKSQGISKAVMMNRGVFLFFTLLLLSLQFKADGLEAYFSMYVSKDWLALGYLLYGALIYLFLAYATALLRNKQIVTGTLQLISLALLVGVMLYPFDSINHVSLLPFLAALQPIILFCDWYSDAWDNIHQANDVLQGIVMLMFVSPIIFVLMLFPVVEKIMIYVVVTMLFWALQLKVGEREGKMRISQINAN